MHTKPNEQWMPGQCVRGPEGDIGVVIVGTFEEPANGYRKTVGVLFDDGSSGCVRMTALTALDHRVSEGAVANKTDGLSCLSELAGHYRRSGATKVRQWLEDS